MKGASKRSQEVSHEPHSHLFAFGFAAFGLILRPASAAPPFEKLPGEQGKTSPLLMRVVQYKGSTNGAITVEVKNPTDTAQEFSAKGIYFVPQGTPTRRRSAWAPSGLSSCKAQTARSDGRIGRPLPPARPSG